MIYVYNRLMAPGKVEPVNLFNFHFHIRQKQT